MLYATAYNARIFHSIGNTQLRNREKVYLSKNKKVSSTVKMEGYGQKLALFNQIYQFPTLHRHLMGEYPVHLPALSGQIRVHIALQGNVGIGVA